MDTLHAFERGLNGLMAIPNLIALLMSVPLLLRLQKEFFPRDI